MLPSLAFAGLRLSGRAAHRSWLDALEAPERAQRALLGELLGDLEATAYGRALGVRARDGYAGFRGRVPVVRYGDLLPWLGRMEAGEADVLTRSKVLFWQTTSGSCGPAKRLPCTASLLGSFRRMFGAWAVDVLERGPKLQSAVTFVAVSPLASELDGAAPVTESGYLSGTLRAALSPFLVPGPEVLSLRDPRAFQDELCRALSRAADRLEVVSVWNPTAFTLLLDELARRPRELAVDNPRALAALAAGSAWPEVFPSLKFVSCWAEGYAAPAAERLAAMFPGALLQAKGLLATEAPVTVPLIGVAGGVPLVNEVFLEFEDPSGEVWPLWSLRRDREYALLLTTRGGLYRYRLGDRVRVAGAHRGTPTLSLAGRADGVVDLVGEKLAEAFVEEALDSLKREAPGPGSGPPGFEALVGVRGETGPSYYALWTDRGGPNLAAALDAQLERSARYREARRLGQLAEPAVFVREDAERRCLEYLAAKGMRLGDIKRRRLVSLPMAESEVSRWAA